MKLSRILYSGGLWALVLVITLGTVQIESAHAWGKKNKPKEERSRLEKKAYNLNQHPEMVFQRGKLSRDHFGNWSLGGKPLAFDRKSRITQKGKRVKKEINNKKRSPVTMEEGRYAMVMGHKRGESLVVYRLTMISADEALARGLHNISKSRIQDPEKEPKEVSPSVEK